MSTSLAFSITVPRDGLSPFVAALAAHLEPDTPCPEAALLAAAATGSELSLSLHFLPDAALERFRAAHPEIGCSVPGQVAIGYLFLTVRGRGSVFEISFHSSSRAVVEVLEESGQLRSLFLRLAGLGQPPELRMTDEWNEVRTLSA